MQLPILLKSRRFWTTVVGAVMSVVVLLVPALAQYSDTLIPVIVILIGMLVGGFSLEDAALAWKNPEATARKLGLSK